MATVTGTHTANSAHPAAEGRPSRWEPIASGQPNHMSRPRPGRCAATPDACRRVVVRVTEPSGLRRVVIRGSGMSSSGLRPGAVLHRGDHIGWCDVIQIPRGHRCVGVPELPEITFTGTPSAASSAVWVWRKPCAWTRFSMPHLAASRGSSSRTYGCDNLAAFQGADQAAVLDARAAASVDPALDDGHAARVEAGCTRDGVVWGAVIIPVWSVEELSAAAPAGQRRAVPATSIRSRAITPCLKGGNLACQ